MLFYPTNTTSKPRFSSSQSVSFLLCIVCCNTSTFSFFIVTSFLFEDFFKTSKQQVTINEWDIKIDELFSGKYSAASNFKKQGELRCNSVFPKTERSQLHQLLSQVEATHPLKLHLQISEQVHCFNLSIEKPTYIPKQVVKSTKNEEKEKRKIETNRKKKNTRNKMK